MRCPLRYVGTAPAPSRSGLEVSHANIGYYEYYDASTDGLTIYKGAGQFGRVGSQYTYDASASSAVDSLLANRASADPLRRVRGTELPIRYSIQSMPEGVDATIDPITGYFRWTPTKPGTYHFVIRAREYLSNGDGTQLQAIDDLRTWCDQAFDVTVGPSGPNDPPYVTPGKDMPDGRAGIHYTARVAASDPDNDQLTFSLVNSPVPNARIDPFTGILTFTPTSGPNSALPYDLVFTVRATDGRGSYGEADVKVHVLPAVNPANDPPQILSDIEGQTFEVAAGAMFDSGPIDIDDNDLQDRYRLVLTAIQKPAGLASSIVRTASGSRGRVLWQTSIADVRNTPYDVTLQVSDGRGGVTTKSFKVRVVAAPPVLTGIDVADSKDPNWQTIFKGMDPNRQKVLSVTATDPAVINDATFTWTYTGTTLPAPQIAPVGPGQTAKVTFFAVGDYKFSVVAKYVMPDGTVCTSAPIETTVPVHVAAVVSRLVPVLRAGVVIARDYDNPVGEESQFTLSVQAYDQFNAPTDIPAGWTLDWTGNWYGTLDETGSPTSRRYTAGVGAGTDTYAETTGYKEKTTYDYDDLGRRSAVREFVRDNQNAVQPSTFTTTTYDPITGGVASIETPEGTIHYEYDPTTGRKTRTYTDSNDTHYTYDAFGRLKTVESWVLNGRVYYAPANAQNPGAPLVTTYAYDDAGNLDTATDDAGTPGDASDDLVHDYDYDALNRLDLETVRYGGVTITDYDYHVRPDGLRDWVRERHSVDGGSTFSATRITWTYDADGRLTSEYRDAGDDGDGTGNHTVMGPGDYRDTFAFDLNGNRMLKAHKAEGMADYSVVAYTYDRNDRLRYEGADTNADGLPDDSTAVTYYYDGNGNQTQRGSARYDWDLRGRMVKASVGDTVTTYAYSTDGVRVSEATRTTTQQEPAVRTFYLVDPLNPTGYAKAVEEWQVDTATNTATLARSYVLGHKVEAQRSGDPETGSTFYYLTDGHGSTRALVDLETGAVAERYDYTAFGTLVTGAGLTSANAATNWLFGGDGVYDPATGWTYHLARWRQDFRFVSYDSFEADISSPANLHKYVYAQSHPSHYTDPTGKWGAVDTLVTVGILAFVAAWLLPKTPWPMWGGSWTGVGEQWFLDSNITADKYLAPDNDHVTMDDILVEFFNSVGPTERYFRQNSFMTEVMRESDTVTVVRQQALQQLGSDSFWTKTYRIDNEDEGIGRFIWDLTRMVWGRTTRGAGGNMGAIGSFHGTLRVSEYPLPNGSPGYEFRYSIQNRTSRESGGGHGPADRPVWQYWEWKELYDTSGNSVPVN